MAFATSRAQCFTSRTAFSRASKPHGTARRSVVLPVRAQEDPAAPSSTQVADEVLSYARQMPGVTPPFPNVFDPANLLATVGSSNTKIRELRRWREAELTHGRVAMLASLGWVTQEALTNWSGSPFPHVQGPALTHFQQVEAKGAIFWEPLVLAIGIAEAYRVAIGWNNPTSENFYTLRDDYEPGNLGFDPLGLLPQDPAAKKDMQSKELNNGRLAMIAVTAFAVQELLERKFVFDQLAERLPGGPAV